MSRKPFVRALPRWSWYFQHPRYMRYMSREITCVFIGLLALVMVCALERLSAGPAAYESFLQALQRPWTVALLLLILGFALHNTTSWFNVTPKAMPIQLGEEFVPGTWIVLGHYAVWVLLSLALLWLGGA